MKIEILSSAMADLAEVRQFYERQSEKLGEYFFDSLFSDIDSLILYAGINLYGDRKAIESAITQYVMNAIKYGNGGSQIILSVTAINQLKQTELSVKNTGIELDRELGPRIWNFGERGKNAFEYHVN